MRNVAFYLGVGTLFTHELDAMLNNEWRVLPLLSALPDDTGKLVFLLMHIPLFSIVIALVASRNVSVRRYSRLAVSLFLVIHGVLHLLFMHHENYQFSSRLSTALIFAAALCGLLYLLLERLSNVTQKP